MLTISLKMVISQQAKVKKIIMKWKHSDYPVKKKFRAPYSATDNLEKGATIKSAFYCHTLCKIRLII